MSATLTITGVVGIGVTLTAGVFTGVPNFTIDCVANTISFTASDGTQKIIAITSATTITATKSGSTYTLTIS